MKNLKKLKSFNKFQTEQEKAKDLEHYGSVGIVFIYENKVFLVKPSKMSGWSYPKGQIEEGEIEKETAVREVAEETGIQLPLNLLDNYELKELNPVIKEKGIKHYWYYTYYLTTLEFKKYFNGLYVLPAEQLQLEEVEDARFVNIKLAKKILAKKFVGILS